MPSVSVIIPNYNHADFLEKRIESVLNQTYQDFEIIILDDKSTDNSIQIINKYIDNLKVSKVIINDKNSGNTFKQWKKGIKEAKGKYIWIAESDDYANEKFLEILTNEFKDKSVGIVFCQSYYVDKENNIIYDPCLDKKKYIETGNDFVIKKMTLGNSIYNASAVIFKKKLAKGIKTPNMHYCGDWFFWVMLLTTTNIAIIEEKLNYFRRHSKSVSSKSEKEGLSFIEGFKILKYIKSNFIINAYDWKRILYKWSYRWSLLFINKETRFNIHLKILIASLRFDYRIAFFTFKYIYYNFQRKNNERKD